MKVQQLKNYGKGFANSTLDPEKVKQMERVISQELRGELGIIAVMNLMWKMRKKIRQMKKFQWSKLRERGFTDQRFLDDLIERTALIRVLVDMVGIQRASEIHRKILDKIAYEFMASMFPSVEALKACGDPFKSFKEYFKAFNTANERAGIHEVKIVEDTDDVFAFNVEYCIWHEVAKEFGDPYLCYPSTCYGDEVFFPRMCAQAGFCFRRNGTLATGAPVCDFGFERRAGGNNN